MSVGDKRTFARSNTFNPATAQMENGASGLTYRQWLLGLVAGGLANAIAHGVINIPKAAYLAVAFTDELLAKIEADYPRPKRACERTNVEHPAV